MSEATSLKNAEIEYEDSSGNVFADMGLENADSLMRRAEIGLFLRVVLEPKQDEPGYIANLLDATDDEVDTLMGGYYHRLSEGRLFDFLRRVTALVTHQTLPEAEIANSTREPVTA